MRASGTGVVVVVVVVVGPGENTNVDAVIQQLPEHWEEGGVDINNPENANFLSIMPSIVKVLKLNPSFYFVKSSLIRRSYPGRTFTSETYVPRGGSLILPSFQEGHPFWYGLQTRPIICRKSK